MKNEKFTFKVSKDDKNNNVLTILDEKNNNKNYILPMSVIDEIIKNQNNNHIVDLIGANGLLEYIDVSDITDTYQFDEILSEYDNSFFNIDDDIIDNLKEKGYKVYEGKAIDFTNKTNTYMTYIQEIKNSLTRKNVDKEELKKILSEYIDDNFDDKRLY